MSGHESKWVAGMRIFAWIFLVAGIIGGIYSAVQLGRTFGEFNWQTGEIQMNFGVFFITFLLSATVTFLITAAIMIFLDMASDVSAIKQHITTYKPPQSSDTARPVASPGSPKPSLSQVTGTPGFRSKKCTQCGNTDNRSTDKFTAQFCTECGGKLEDA